MSRDVMMSNGKILPGEKIDKLVNFIINKFAEEEMSVDEAKIALEHAKEIIGEYSTVKPIDL